MATISAETSETITFDAPLSEVWALLADPEAAGSHIPDLVSIEALGDHRYAYRFEPVGFKSISFEPQYTAKFTTEPDSRIRWQAEPGGNLRQSGEWRLEAAGDAQTRAELHVEVEAYLPVPRLLKGAAAPFFRDQFRRTIQDWVAGLQSALS